MGRVFYRRTLAALAWGYFVLFVLKIIIAIIVMIVPAVLHMRSNDDEWRVGRYIWVISMMRLRHVPDMIAIVYAERGGRFFFMR